MSSPVRYVEAPGESIFFRRLNAKPEWLVTPIDTPSVAVAKLTSKMAFLQKIKDAIQSQVFRDLEAMLYDHVRIIDGEDIWKAISESDKKTIDALAIERMGIVLFFGQFHGLDNMIKGIEAQIEVYKIPVDPEIQSQTGQADPDLDC